MRFHARSLYVLALLCASFAAAGNQNWKTLAMTGGIALQYPDTWWPVSAEKERLNILSSKGGAEGVVIQKNQAQIIVSTAPQPAGDSFDRLIALSVGKQTVVSTAELAATAPHGCMRLREVLSREEVGPTSYVSATAIFCDTGLTSVTVLLRAWQNDEQLRQYQEVALRMARSIRRTQ
jgi:hypothetical protein